MTVRDISATEWVAIRIMRAEALTGYAVHKDPFVDSADTRVRSYYVWPMGRQPEGATRRALAAGCPLRAAEKFLALYAPNPVGETGYRDQFRQPCVTGGTAT